MDQLQEIGKKFINHGKKLYIVGGFCREKILGIKKYQTDIDLCSDATPEEIQKITTCIGHIGKKYGTVLISSGKEKYELTTFRKDIGILDNRKPVNVEFTTDLHEDALRRDFTCNAIYIDPLTQEYIDPVGGIRDIQNKIIRFIGSSQDRITEDALRILRFIRIKNKYNFQIAEKNYFEILKNNISLLKNISKERIKDELDKILLDPNNIQALKDLKEIGFFTLFLTEIEKQSQTPGSKYHQEGNVWVHTLMTLEYLNSMDLSGKNKTEKLDLYWAMFLHDIAKPICYSCDSDGNGHYYGHERSGSEIFKQKISQELPFSKKSQKKITWIIENHLRIFKVFEMKKLKARKLMTHPYWEELMIIGEADHMGRIPASFSLITQLYDFYNNFLKIFGEKKFYTGQDIMKLYPNLQGKQVGDKLQVMNDEILQNDLQKK